MPITVNCTCGKVFRVRDEAAGTVVKCQVCGAPVTVVAAAMAAATVAVAAPPRPQPVPVPAMPAAPRADMVECPACAEMIPIGVRRCPSCDEAVAVSLTAAQAEGMIAERLAGIDALESDPAALAADAALRGMAWSVQTIVLGVFLAGSVLLLLAGVVSHAHDADVAVGFGIFLGLCFGIPFCVSLSNDHAAHHIQDALKPEQAYKRWIQALKTRRTNKAFAALAPAARTVGHVETIRFSSPKIRPPKGEFSIEDLKTFKKYWSGIVTLGSLGGQRMQLGKVRCLKQGDDRAVIEARMKFMGCAEGEIAIGYSTEERTVRKLLLKRGGRWYFAEGEFEGTLDRVRL